MKICKLFLSIILCYSAILAYDYIAVVPFTVKGIAKEESSTLTDIFVNKYNKAAKYKIMELSQSDQILKELKFKWDPSFSELSNALAMARLLSVQYIITGQIEKQNNISECNLKVFDFRANKRIKNIIKSYQGTPIKLLSLVIPQIAKPMDKIIVNDGVIVAASKQKETTIDTEMEEISRPQKIDIVKTELPEEKPDVIDKKVKKESEIKPEAKKETTTMSRSERKKNKMEEKRKRKEAVSIAKTEEKRKKALEKYQKEKEEALKTNKPKTQKKIATATTIKKKPEKDIVTKKEEPKKEKIAAEKKSDVYEKRAITKDDKPDKDLIIEKKEAEKNKRREKKQKRKKQASMEKAERKRIKMEEKYKHREAATKTKTEEKRKEALEKYKQEKERILGTPQTEVSE